MVKSKTVRTPRRPIGPQENNLTLLFPSSTLRPVAWAVTDWKISR